MSYDNNKGNYKFLEQGYPPGELYKIQLINRRDYALECINHFVKLNKAGSSAPTHFLKSSVATLFLDLEPNLKKFLNKEEFEKIEKYVSSDDVKEVISAFRKMNSLLFEIRIIALTEDRSITAILSKEKTINEGEEWED